MAKNTHSPAAYGKAMKSAHESMYGKVPAKAKITMKMSMPAMDTSMRGSTPMHRSKTRSAASKLFGGRY